MKKILLYTLLISLPTILFAQGDAISNNPKLGYMIDQGVFQGLEYAKTKSKPSLIYFNSNECHSCETFTEMVMTQKDMVTYTKNTFISINANIENGDARRISRKYKAYMLPAIVLINAEQDFEYTCKLTLDKEKVMFQLKNFFNAVALRDQILLLQRTNHLELDDAARQIGASYAKIDYRKSATANPEELLESRTLGMKFFEQCGDAYLEEWSIQKSKVRTSHK